MFRVAGIYAVAAWAVVEVADVVFPALNIPPWALSLVVVLALLGAPLAVVLAWALEVTPDGVRRTPPLGGEPAGSAPSHLRSFPQGLVWVSLAAVVVLGGAAFFLRSLTNATNSAEVDPAAIAILPFRTAGATEELSYLGEGMVDLLAAKFDGDGGPRAADPRQVIQGWQKREEAGEGASREAAMDFARELGIGRVLLGNVVGNGSRIVIEAVLHDAVGGKRQAQAMVEGDPDSLTVLVDRLAGSLLALESGMGDEQLSSLTTRSLPALRAYLAGERAFRRGAYDEAYDFFDRALDIDSTFALAGVGLSNASAWTYADGSRGARIAWAHRDRLPRLDRRYVEALLRPVPLSDRDQLQNLREAVEILPERPRVWYALGDAILHHHRILGIDDWAARSAEHFETALRLDSTYSEAHLHLAPTLLSMGDSLGARAAADRYLAWASAESDISQTLRWVRAKADADDGALHRLRQEMPDFGTTALMGIQAWAAFWGEALDSDGDRPAARLRQAEIRRPSEKASVLMDLYAYRLMRGHWGEAAQILREIEATVPASRAPLRLRILQGLYGPDSPQDPAVAVGRLKTHLATPPSTSEERWERLLDLCVVEQWRLWNGRSQNLEESLELLREAAASGEGVEAVAAEGCATLLRAIAGAVEGTAEGRKEAERLDSMLATGTFLPTFGSRVESMQMEAPARLAAARIFESYGQPDRALDVLGRWPAMVPGWFFLQGTTSREEGRLAASVGDRRRAAQAYRRFLVLRSADPELQPELERVREALKELGEEVPPLDRP